MAEKLTKTALKNELSRRIDYFEEKYKFNPENTSLVDMQYRNQHVVSAYGRYLALRDMRWQIENNLFINGYAC